MMDMAIPPEAEIARVMRDQGLDRMQAINHLRQLATLRRMPDRRFA